MALFGAPLAKVTEPPGRRLCGVQIDVTNVNQ